MRAWMSILTWARADMDVVFDGVDLTENREGLIQITDINRLTVDTNNSSTVSVGFGSDVHATYLEWIQYFQTG